MRGRTIRAMIAANARPDTKDEIAARRKRIDAGRQAHAEALARFGGVTPDNARAFIEWQARRMDELENTNQEGERRQ